MDGQAAERAQQAMEKLLALRARDVAGASGDDLAKRWGGIYWDKFHDKFGVGKALGELQARAMVEYSSTNAMYPQTYPSLPKMEAQLINYVVNLVGGSEKSCGLLASGGTEAIYLAALAHREWAKSRGIERPEIIASGSAHPAIMRAAFYFGLEVKCVSPDPETLRLEPRHVRPLLSKATCMIYASAPSFPHGVVDDVRGLSSLAEEHGCGLHVDNCLGGILLQHLFRAGVLRPGGPAEAAAEALRLPGVTSMSVDLHKYGYCPKGASVTVFRDRELRRRVWATVPCVPGSTVSGSNYITPTLQGTRGGAHMAAAWATVRCMAGEGYLQAARRLNEAYVTMREGMLAIPDVEAVGDGELSILAFRVRDVAVGSIAKGMRSRGWGLNMEENPKCLNICVGEQHFSNGANFVEDLRSSRAECGSNSPDAPVESVGAYQAAEAGASAQKMHEKLLRYMEKTLDDLSGPPEAKL